VVVPTVGVTVNGFVVPIILPWAQLAPLYHAIVEPAPPPPFSVSVVELPWQSVAEPTVIDVGF
jgi:hypothetical protein